MDVKKIGRSVKQILVGEHLALEEFDLHGFWQLNNVDDENDLHFFKYYFGSKGEAWTDTKKN